MPPPSLMLGLVFYYFIQPHDPLCGGCGRSDRDEFMGILAREAQARDHSLPYCNSSKALDSRENVTRRENGQPFHLGTHKEACRSQASRKEPQQTCDGYLKSLPGQAELCSVIT